MSKTILAYITEDDKKVVGGDPLTLCVADEKERKSIVLEISRAMNADVIQLKNGDYLIIGTT